MRQKYLSASIGVIVLMITIACPVSADILYTSVPSYDQQSLDFDLDGFNEDPPGVCAEFSIAMVFGYYDNNGWKRFIPYGSASALENPRGVYELVNTIISQVGSGGNGMTFDDYSTRLNINALSRTMDPSGDFTSHFSCELDDVEVTWDLIKSSLMKNGPGNLCVLYDFEYYDNQGTIGQNQNHVMVTIGFKENFSQFGVSGNWVLLKSTWDNGDEGLDPLWINWDDIDEFENYLGYLHFYEGGSPSSSNDTTDDDYEDNDYRIKASQISSPFNALMSCNDYDWFEISLDRGDKIDAQISFVNSDGNLDVYLYDFLGRELATSETNLDEEEVNHVASIAGNYYVLVKGRDFDQNTYTISISKTRATYAISGYVRTSGGAGINGVTVTFNNGGGTETTDGSGYYSGTVSYGWSGSATPSLSGYTFTPTSLTYINVTTSKSNQNYTGTPLSGGLRVTLLPTTAVSAGAQWNVDGGVWQYSGATVSRLGVGSHTVKYRAVSGWTAPSSETVTITNGQTTALTRNYTQQGSILIGDAVDALNLTWTTGGGGTWFGQTQVAWDGVDAAQSHAITGNEQTWMETTVEGPGTISFYWRVSSESNHDFLRFYIGSSVQASISGSVSWEQKSFSIPQGNQTLRWSYSKDSSVNSGSDCGWVDNVVYSSGVYKDELVLNFGSDYGLYQYDRPGGWNQWNTINPSQMVIVDLNGDGADELVADFPGYGLYKKDSANDWQKINDVEAEKMIAADIDRDGKDELVASFIGYGLYYYDDPGGWVPAPINTVIPDALVRYSEGVVCDFGAAYGLWSYSTVGGWSQLNTVDPDKIVAADIDGDGEDELVVLFVGWGLYTYEPVGDIWQQINTAIPDEIIAVDIDGDGNDELVISFTGYGLYVFEPQGLIWQQPPINTVIPEVMIRLGSGIAADFGAAYGLWTWSWGKGWQLRNTADPGQMTVVDIENDGVQELVVSFPGYGLWYYGETNGWQFLNDVIPDDVKPINFYP